MSRVVAALLLAALAAGCAGGGSRVHSVSLFSPYQPIAAASFAAAGPTVEVRGAPPGGASPEAVAAALKLPATLAQTPFRVAPADAAGQRIVLVFGASSVDPARICAAGAGGGGGQGGSGQGGGGLAVGAAFCIGAVSASVGVLSAPGVSGPPDPAFTPAMRGLFTEMMPAAFPGRGQFGGL